MKSCIYCGQDKPDKDFSEEHIWPKALGGGALPGFWRTEDICVACNSMSGLFVDGEFIKGHPGNTEKYLAGLEYANVDDPTKAVFPLAFLGKLQHPNVDQREVAELWTAPCGAAVIHFRPGDQEQIWTTYSGGDPRVWRSRGRTDRVYIVLASKNEFWILAALASVKAHFGHPENFIVNAAIPSTSTAFKAVDRNNATQRRDMIVVSEIVKGTHKRYVQSSIAVRLDTGHRFLAKLALAVGYKIFGKSFLETNSARELRRGFREVNPDRRQDARVRGTGYLSNQPEIRAPEILGWRGAWVLITLTIDSQLALVVVPPSGRLMTIMVSDDKVFNEKLDELYKDGIVWLTVPTLGTALGPLSLLDYLAHQSKTLPSQQLLDLENRRISRSDLPRC